MPPVEGPTRPARITSDRLRSIIADVPADASGDDGSSDSDSGDSDVRVESGPGKKAAAATKARWTKSDSVRLIELVRSPDARKLMTQASDVQTRAELDNRKNMEDPWEGECNAVSNVL